jgi:putative transposase
MTAYPSDLTDFEWRIIEKEVPKPRKRGRGRKRSVTSREIINAIFYVLDNGTKWRSLPHDYPKWQTVYWYFNQWSKDGTIEKIHRKMRKITRVALGKNPNETVAIIDSQSTKSVEQAQKESIGFDAGKKNKGKKTPYTG